MLNIIHGDKGKKFVNRKFKSFLKDHRVQFFSTENDDIKASVVERFNRTLNSKMWRYFTYSRKKRYVDILDDIIFVWLQTTPPTSGVAITAVTNCCANCVEISRMSNGVHFSLFGGKPAMRTNWMAGAGPHKCG